MDLTATVVNGRWICNCPKGPLQLDGEMPSYFIAQPVKWAINFTNEKSEDVGRLEFDDEGRLTFEGNTTEAAEIFFLGVIRTNNERMKDLEIAMERLASMEAFLLSRAMDPKNPADAELLARIEFAQKVLDGSK